MTRVEPPEKRAGRSSEDKPSDSATAAEVAGHKGLTTAEAVASREEHGNNVLTPPARDPWWKLLLEKFDDPVIRILLVAAVISFVAGAAGGGHYVEALGICAAVFLATFLAFLNEYRAEAEFDILNRVNDEVPVKVVRDGAFTTVPKRDVVVGDLVLVETGDEIPADGDLVEAVSLQVDESRLTGESHPAHKFVRDPARKKTSVKAEADTAYPPHRLLRSTLVADGHGAMIVTAVGDHTEIGMTARAAAEETGEVTPLNRQLERLSKLIGVVGFSIASITFTALFVRALWTGEFQLESGNAWFLAVAALGAGVATQKIWVPVVYDGLELVGRDVALPPYLEEGGLEGWLKTVVAGVVGFGALLGLLIAVGGIPSQPAEWISLDTGRQLLEYFMIAVVIVVVAVPEGLAMSVTLSLAYSMRKMTASNNLVRRMHATETVGAATVICSDKTGTLTQNRMRVFAARVPAFSETETLTGEALADLLASTEAGRLVADGIAVNATANLSAEDERDDDGSRRMMGDPTEGALLIWLEDAGVPYLPRRNEFEVEHQWAFDTARKYMATIGGSDRILHVKGAPELVLSRCVDYLGEGGQQKPLNGFPDQVLAELEDLQARGMRTLGLAYRDLEPDEELSEEADEACQDLTWLGFFAIADPVREDVPDAVARARQAGIDVKIVTGDTPVTAKEIARQVTILEADDDDPHAVMLGSEFGKLSDADVKERLPRLRVLARARPIDKLTLVQKLQEQGHVVAVTGDGTNDAPALNYADVGLAMGRQGTSVAKEAADIVLLDDSFPSIVNAVKWGRSLYRNIQRFILFQLTINVAACIVAMLGPFIGIELPLTVMQMLWVNLIMDTFAALALATEPPRDEVLKEPPRDPSAFIITRNMAVNILGVGGIFVVLMILLLKTNYLGTGEPLYELTLFFNFFVMLQFWNLFNARTLGSNRSALKGLTGNTGFLAIASAILVGQFLIIQVGGEVFRTTPLGPIDWLKTMGLASLVLIVGELVRWRRRSLDAQAPVGRPAVAAG